MVTLIAALILSIPGLSKTIQLGAKSIHLEVVENPSPEPVSKPKWILMTIDCRGKKKTHKISVCTSDLETQIKDDVLTVIYYNWDPIKSTQSLEGRIFCDLSAPKVKKIKVSQLCH